jgi:NADH:ubiquinone oxidoreductase subunit F (NADH-binding)
VVEDKQGSCGKKNVCRAGGKRYTKVGERMRYQRKVWDKELQANGSLWCINMVSSCFVCARI